MKRQVGNILGWFHRPPLLPTHPAPSASRWSLFVGVCLGIWLCLYLYADSLSLPFLQEDSFHIRWLSWHNVIEPFFTAVGAPDYRPLGKVILKIWYLILGEHNRAWLRYQNILLNVLNIVLTAWLASRVDRGPNRYITGGISAVFFAILPFAYQAIPWINNFFYPLANFLLLAMTAVYWQARLCQSNKLLGLAFFLCFLAPFEIEYGLMGSGLLLSVELVLWWQKRQPYPWLGGPFIGLGMNLLFLIRSLTIPKEPYAFGPPTLNRTFLILTYFLQGAMFPISPLAVPLMNQTGLSDVAAIWLVCLPALVLLVGWLVYRRQGFILLLAGLWFILLNLPALVFVNFDYVVNGPRLLYPPGVAIGWVWGAIVAEFASRQVGKSLKIGYSPLTIDHSAPSSLHPFTLLPRRLLTAVFLIFVIQQNVAFVQHVMWHYHLAERPFAQLMQVARNTPPDDELLLVNFPSWITPATYRFVMGNHGAQFIPFYINIQDVIYAHNDTDHPARAIQFLNIRQPTSYFNGMLGEVVDYEGLKSYLESGGSVYVTQWGETEMNLVYAGRVMDIPFHRTAATFGEMIALEFVNSDHNDDQITLQLNWQLRQKVTQDLTVFMHLYGPDGSLVSQADGYPLLGLSPFWLWENNQTLQEQRTLIFPPDTPPGIYQVAVGIYDPAANQRLPALDTAGNPLPNNAFTLLTVERP